MSYLLLLFNFGFTYIFQVCTSYFISLMYHQQQNIWYPPKVFTCPFRSYLHFSRAEFTCPVAHNNITILYYGQVKLLRLKSSVTSKWASKHLWGYHLFCCWWYIVENNQTKEGSANLNITFTYSYIYIYIHTLGKLLELIKLHTRQNNR